MLAWEDYSAYDANVGGIAIVDLTRYGLGARGIDLISAKRTTSEIANDELMTNVTTDPVLGSTNERVSFPLYDGHGNTIATLARNGTGYSIANVKRYDVWGRVRSDSSVGSSGQILNPTQRYCGNLGHKFDSTSGLTYMRARYYEAETGRFISEDPARDGLNYYEYANNDPILNVDGTGEAWSSYLSEMYKWFEKARTFAASASANPDLVTKNRRAIREIIKRIGRIGNTAEILGEDLIVSGAMTDEDAAAMGNFAEIGIDIGQGEIAAGGGTMSMKVVAACLQEQLEMLLLMME